VKENGEITYRPSIGQAVGYMAGDVTVIGRLGKDAEKTFNGTLREIRQD
jgi:hypothetical protein